MNLGKFHRGIVHRKGLGLHIVHRILTLVSSSSLPLGFLPEEFLFTF